jgi:hypothetical protein
MKHLCIVAGALLFGGFAQALELSDKDRDEVLTAVVEHLERDYVEAEVGRKGAQQLRRSMKAKGLDSISQGEPFAKKLTELLREATGDGHLAVEYSENTLAEDAAAANEAFTEQEMLRYYGPQVNHGVKKAERLDNNVGLLELSVFPPSSMGGDTIAAAMNVIAHTDALIIDLRNNGGGSDTVELVASYLFDEQQPLSGIYDRPRDALTHGNTQAYVPGAKFGSAKPVYVLISKRTFSAAEALAYDLQALKRATIVGQPSGGGAHPFNYHRIHPHFVLWSVTQKSVNPITGKNWQGVGVQPDIHVESERALEKALELIEKRQAG